MASKYVKLEEAAKTLGMSPDELNEMRQRRDISAYRDGSSWKFKVADIEKLAADKPSSASESELNDDLRLDDFDELEVEPADASSAQDEDAAMTLADDLDLDLEEEESETLKEPAQVSKKDDDISSEMDDLDLAMSDSEDLSAAVEPKAEAKTKSSEESLDLDLDLDLADDGSGTSSELELMSDDSMIGASAKDLSKKPAESDEDDEALVLTESSHDELSLDTEDSGVSLLEDESTGSELKLDDDPLDLDDSDALSSDLDEENLIVSGEKPAAGVSPEGATKMDVADEFELTPFDEVDSDISDSGSQVIALDSAEDLSSEPFGETTDEGSADMFEPAATEPLPHGPSMVSPSSMSATSTAVEAPYGTGLVVSLGFCSLLLLLTGLMMVDIMFNLGTWNDVSPVTGTLMDLILGS